MNHTVTPLGSVIISLLIIAAKVVFDWWLIEKKKKSPNHTFEILIVITLYAVLGWLSGGLRYPVYGLALAFHYAFTFFALFDASLNLARGKNIWYVGEESWIDRQVSRLGAFYIHLKLFAIGISFGTAFVIIKYGIDS